MLRRLSVFLIFILLAGSNRALGQGCCLTDSVTINTGYNPLSLTGILPDVDGGASIQDPKWKVSYYTDSVHAAAVLNSFTCVSIGAAANVVLGGAAHSDNAAISCMNSSYFQTNGQNPPDTTKWYYMDLYREVTLCDSAALRYDLNISADNGVDVYFDPSGTPAYNPGASPSLFFMPSVDGYYAPNWSFYNHYQFTTAVLPPGVHRLTIRLYQYNHPTNMSPPQNHCYMRLWGSVVSLNGVQHVNELFREYNACASFPYCPKPQITGHSHICTGQTDTLYDAFGGGTWSATGGVVTINSSGVVTAGNTPGVATITYTDLCGRKVTFLDTVIQSPSPITGPNPSWVCVNQTVSFTDVTTPGTWQVTNGHASINSSGYITGVTSGLDTIIYTTSNGCTATKLVTVNPLPVIVIDSLPAICQGNQTAYLYWTSNGNSSWAVHWSAAALATGFANTSSPTPAPHPIALSVPLSAAPGTYSGQVIFSNGFGCEDSATFTLIIHAGPAAITGLKDVCRFQAITLTDLTTGGSWSSYNNNPLTLQPPSSVNVTGVVVGIDTIFYTAPGGCKAKDTITVHPQPNAGMITYPSSPIHLCVGTSDTLGETEPGGTWVSTNPAILQITGVSGSHCNVLAQAVGTVTVMYVDTSSFGCTDTAFALVTIDTNGIYPITGILGVCANSTTQLSDATPNVTWAMSCPYATISGTGLVTAGPASGICTVTATLNNACGSYNTWATVLVNMPPYITTKSIVACQQLAQNDGNAQVLDDGSGCIKVCDSSVVRYYAGGVNGATFSWSVTGGTIIANYGNDSIDVFWPNVGVPASITLYATAPGCTSQRTVCINVIAKPHAAFSVLPDLTPATGVVNVCLNSTEYFHDLSVGDPQSQIVSWYWDFGDGSNASSQNSSHEFTTAGYDTVKLIVKNECNCADTYKVVLRVYTDPGPVINCTAVQCENTTATYSTATVCGMYYWSVIGGTILSGSGTPSIQVNWNNADSNGFGYVNLQESCGGGTCPDTTVLKVPVVTSNAHIVGPDTVCANRMYDYTLPLWPGTQYHWSVLNDLTGVVGSKNDHVATIQIATEGIYTIHAWFENDVRLCGNNLDKTIVVVPPSTVSGDSLVCTGMPATFTLSGSVSSYTWTITDPLGNITTGTGTGNTFTTAFPSVGVFQLSFSGGFCVDPYIVTVQKTPPAIDSIVGPDTVCLNRVYSYHAFTNDPNMVYNWQIVGGTVTPGSCINGYVTVVWTSGGLKQLSVQHANLLPPNCAGPLLTKTVTQEVINPYFSGDTTPCANSYRPYDCHYTRGEYYEWQIIPNTAGSVMAGQYGSYINVLWNNTNVPVNAALVLTIHKCDSIIRDTLNIVVHPGPGATVSASSATVCPGAPVLFTAAAGGLSYHWNFGDGTTAASTTDTITHVFPANPTNGNQTYTVEVMITPDYSQLCPASGYAFTYVSVKPGPVAYASVGTPTCADGVTPIDVYGTVTNNVTGLTYQWYESGTAITGATNATYTTLTQGVFSFLVTADNGCSALSNTAEVLYCLNDSVYGNNGPCTATASSTVTCNTIALSSYDFGGSNRQWYYGVQPATWIVSVGNAWATYNTPGVYGFGFSENIDGCGYAHTTVLDTIGAVVDFNYNIACGTPGAGAAPAIDTVKLHDHTATLPGYNIINIAWTYGYMGTNANIPLVAPGTYTVTETVTIERPNLTTYNCTQTRVIVLPSTPSVDFTFYPDSVCQGIPISFNSSYTGGVVSYLWTFGDGSGVVLANPQRTYTWDPLQVSNPNVDTVHLKVTDTIGCTVTATKTVHVYENRLAGSIGADDITCTPIGGYTLAYNPAPTTPTPTSYLWSNGATTSTINFFQSGTFWLTVADVRQCQRYTPNEPFEPVHITLINPPTAIIYGQHEFCNGDVINLSGYAGTGVDYYWTLDNNPDGTTPYISDGSIAIGDHIYQLALSVTYDGITCADTSGPFLAHMYPLPDPPTVDTSIVSCKPYEVQLTAAENVSGTFNWSNGLYGPSIDVYTGGPYKVWFTNQYGCKASTNQYVPQPPAYYFDYFPSGCYPLCASQFPFNLYGPPDVGFAYWAWLKDGGGIAGEGYNSVMNPYSIPGNIQLNWILDNGFCRDTSAPMNISFDTTCSECVNTSDHTYLDATAECTPSNPASYSVGVTLYSPAAGTTYTLGTQNEGPLVLSTGTLPGTGTYNVTVTFTTLQLPPPGDVVIEVEYVFPDGTKCFKKQDIPLEPCTWTDAEQRHSQTPPDTPRLVKPAVTDNQTNNAVNGKTGTQLGVIANALSVFPNPSSGEVTMSYNFGTTDYKRKGLAIYDALGQKMAEHTVNDANGQWKVDTRNWADGLYTIVMEADGIKLQTQRLVVQHQ